MDYSTDSLKKIEKLASQLTPITEIGALLDFDEISFRDDINTPGNPARKAFLKGYACTANRLRKNNLGLSYTGSPAADEACRGYLRKMLSDLNT